MSNKDNIVMSYLKEQHLVQEEHFPALDFKCGDD